MTTALFAGFTISLSLIVAIGAQNAFVLRQGLRREHVLPVVLTCALSDAVLISAGVAGMGAAIADRPALLTAVRWTGAAFLLGYAALAARRALRPGTLSAASRPAAPLRATLLTCLALTWLNPHVYLDTVLLGGIATQYGHRWHFAAGAALASLTWFTALGAGSHRLAGVLDRPAAWRILDATIAVVMTVIATGLLLA